jgi:hypothetical protein
MGEAVHDRDPERNDPTALRVARLAERQEGVVKEAQLRALGLDRFAVARWVRSGRLHPLYPGVYAVGHRALSRKGQVIAALFYAGPGSALSHRSGAHWWGLVDHHPPEIHVSVARRTRPQNGIALHHPRRVEPVLHHQLPVTPVARTLLDLATEASIHELRKALAEADYRNRLVIRELQSVMGQGRPGSRKLRAAVDAHLPELARTESPLEEEFMLLCERFEIPLPEPNVWIAGHRVDALWREERVVVELDGRSAHGPESRRLNDHERDLRLRALGYVVRRFSWHQVFTKPETVATDIRRTLAARQAAARS